jgi:hypothetical protein
MDLVLRLSRSVGGRSKGRGAENVINPLTSLDPETMQITGMWMEIFTTIVIVKEKTKRV